LKISPATKSITKMPLCTSWLLNVIASLLLAHCAAQPDESMEEYILNGLEFGADVNIEASDANNDLKYLLSNYQLNRFHPHPQTQGGIRGSYVALMDGKCGEPNPMLDLLKKGEKLPKLNYQEFELSTYHEVAEILRSSCVKQLEQNGEMFASYTLPPWGLDMIDGSVSDGKYTKAFTGQDVDVFVLDTGIDPNHAQLAGRVGNGHDFTGGGSTQDVQGHGTHCAGTIAGTDVGVAPGATVIPMKVLADNGSGSWSWLIAALDMIIEEKEKRSDSGRPMLVSASLGGGYYKLVNDAFNQVVDAGVFAVVASGNSNRDASGYSPASAEKVITVSAIDLNQNPAWFSNYGDLVNVWAPGVNVLSAKANSGDGLVELSGTSMACPHVAGVVALILESQPNWTMDSVTSNLYQQCTEDSGAIKSSTGRMLRTFAAYGSESQCAASGNQPPLSTQTSYV